MIARIAILTALLAASPALMPTPETTQSFDRYVSAAEGRVRQEESTVDTFVALPSGPVASLEADLRKGGVVIIPGGSAATEIPGGLIHDWTGVVLIPHATVARVVAAVQDYDHLARYYSPEVVASRLMSRDGDDFHIFLRMRQRDVITVVLDSEYDVHYGRLDASHQFSFSRSTRITEIADAGEAKEYALSAADNHGFLWRLNSYWRFAQEGDGVLVECEAISLTRDVPTGLGWLIGPYVKEIPRESLRSALIDTRAAAEAGLH